MASSRSWRSHWLFGILIAAWALLMLILIITAIFIGMFFVGRKRSFWFFAPKLYLLIFGPAGIQVETYEKENMPPEIISGKQPIIFMANHATQLDAPLVLSVCPVGATLIVKKEIGWVPFLNFAAWAAHAIFIDRSNSEKARKSIEQATERIRRGQSVFMYPEGTRTRTGSLLPFKKGGFVMAQNANVPIVPCAMTGGYQLMPPGTLRIHPGKMIVRVGKPMWPKDFQSVDTFMTAVRNDIQRMIDLDLPRL